ncbi:MAG: dolichyl-phosphate-mannose--protein mannosyltransferase, partial [Ferruginibacter sp.]|nr:dolichyl-phosphate-mannose--protein mannosyltransferase [Ferruginibacter sp.]
MNFKRKTIQLIFIATIIRIAIASIIGLGNDEVYYRMYAQDLQWNYFDHPPMVGWMIRLTTFNLILDSELFIRSIAILSSAVSTWM